MVVDPWLKPLKLFVVVAGVLILLGSGTLAWLLASGAARGRTAAEPVSAGASAPIAATAAASEPILADLPLPAGAAIVDLVAEGDRILLLLRTATGEDYLAVVDAATGRRRALLRIVPERR
ncbi:MAG: hypothetical protein NZ555_14580 [Geminicoccaceae bacterium]|nr:hypothetical protein [Geminicoccaceae bacterium]MCX8100891.1 hypothetical protein [Geminicoccaceae bacterium]MDW8369881.1 hypothetical protein [Geminicoccaceae bacterium]